MSKYIKPLKDMMNSHTLLHTTLSVYYSSSFLDADFHDTHIHFE